MNNTTGSRMQGLWMASLVLALLSMLVWFIPTSVYADDCETDPANAADCMRTPRVRNAINIIAQALGMGPVTLMSQLKARGIHKKLNRYLSRRGPRSRKKAVDWVSRQLEKPTSIDSEQAEDELQQEMVDSALKHAGFTVTPKPVEQSGSLVDAVKEWAKPITDAAEQKVEEAEQALEAKKGIDQWIDDAKDGKFLDGSSGTQVGSPRAPGGETRTRHDPISQPDQPDDTEAAPSMDEPLPESRVMHGSGADNFFKKLGMDDEYRKMADSENPDAFNDAYNKLAQKAWGKTYTDKNGDEWVVKAVGVRDPYKGDVRIPWKEGDTNISISMEKVPPKPPQGPQGAQSQQGQQTQQGSANQSGQKGQQVQQDAVKGFQGDASGSAGATPHPQVSVDPSSVTTPPTLPTPVSVDASSVTTPPTPVSVDAGSITTPPTPVSVDAGSITSPPTPVSVDAGSVTTPPTPVSVDAGSITTPPTPVSVDAGSITTPPTPVSVDAGTVTTTTTSNMPSVGDTGSTGATPATIPAAGDMGSTGAAPTTTPAAGDLGSASATPATTRAGGDTGSAGGGSAGNVELGGHDSAQPPDSPPESLGDLLKPKI